MDVIWAKWAWQPNQAQSGYVETSEPDIEIEVLSAEPDEEPREAVTATVGLRGCPAETLRLPA
jgi:hypothetical protein